MYANQTNMQNNTLPVPCDQMLRNKWYTPSELPELVRVTYTPERSYYFSQQTLQNVTGHLVGTIQHRASSGGALSTFMYNLLSSNQYSNEYFAKVVDSVYELLDTSDEDEVGNINSKMLTDAVSDTISLYYYIFINEFPVLNQYLTHQTIDSIMKRARVVNNIRNRQLNRGQQQPAQLNHSNYINPYEVPAQTPSNNPIFPNQTPQQADMGTSGPGVQRINQLNHGQNNNSGYSNHHVNHHNQSNAVTDPNLQFLNPNTNNASNQMSHPNVPFVNAATDNSTFVEPEIIEDEIFDSRFKQLSDEQQGVVTDLFDGEIPEGAMVIPYNFGKGSEKVLLLPVSAVEGIYDPQTVFKNSVGKNVYDHYDIHVPAYNSVKQVLRVIIRSDGTRNYLIDDRRDTDVNIEDHIPAGAKVDWDGIKSKELINSDGNIVSDGKAFVFDTPVTASPSVASATANYAMRSVMDKSSYGQETKRSVEYRVNQANAFYVDDPVAVLNVLKLGRKSHDMVKLIKDIKEVTKENPKLRRYIDESATKIINEFTLYSVGADIVIDSFLDDYRELMDIVTEEYSPVMTKIYEKSRDAIVDRICTAVSASSIDDFTLPITVTDEKGEDNLDKDAEITSNLILMVEMSQVTEIPYTFEELNIGLYQPHELSKPHGMIDQTEMPDLHSTIGAIVNRQGEDKAVPSSLETKDGTVITIHRSAYEHLTYILVKEN